MAIQLGGEGLVRTTLHSMEQEAFVVTEDRMTSFNNYSFEFQIILAFFSISLGVALGNVNDIKENVFIISAVLTLTFGCLLWWGWLKFEKAKKSLFVRPQSPDFQQLNLKIIKAVYGTDQKNIDVTARLNELVKNNVLDIVASNNIAGDPHYGVTKQLKVEYELGTENFSNVYQEGMQVRIS